MQPASPDVGPALAGLRPAGRGASGLLNTSQNLGGAIGVAVASSIAASRFHTLANHGYANQAALTGGFHWALRACWLTGLVAVPAAVLLIRRTQRPGTELVPDEPEVTMAIIGE